MIELSHIEKTFNARTMNEVHVLRDVSLSVGKGEFVTLIGTNGSGKSTLLNVVAGSILPDSGTVVIAEKDVTKKSDFERARHVARVFQNPFMGTAPGMTIAENLLLAHLRGQKHFPTIGLTKGLMEFFRKRVEELEMQLEERLSTVIGTLSGGQRQAVSLLMAVIREPQVLLLDEHTAALDPKSAAQIVEMVNIF